MGSTAFELREELTGTVKVEQEDGSKETVDRFTGAVIAVPPNGESFDVKAALEDGSGQIVVSDENVQLAETLRGLAALKETAPAEGAEAISSYEAQTKPQLVEEAKRRELNPGGKSKEELVELLKASDEARAAGEPADTPEEG